MEQINQREKNIISKKYPHVHITRTMRARSGRKRYYMAEEAVAMRLLKSLRRPAAAAAEKEERECDYRYKHNL